MARILVTSPESRANTGNGVTAARWAGHLRALGHSVKVLAGRPERDSRSRPPDLLVALHALRSAHAIDDFRRRHPERPTILALTGTDVYRDLGLRPAVLRSLESADRIVVLQPLAIAELPRRHRAKARVIYQSVDIPATLTSVPEPSTRLTTGSTTRFTIAVLAHLRAVKDPLRAARAARLLPPESRIQIVHAGAVREPRFEIQARREMERNARYRWVGDLPRARALRLLSRAQALVLSSRLEGGANVLSEAAVLGIPVLASRISGSVGLLGPDYPGYFPVGDSAALAELMERAESEPTFLHALRRGLRPLAAKTRPKQERASWRALLDELGVAAG